MEIGIYDFAEVFPDPQTGETISTADRLRNLVEQVELADQVGLEVFGLGEHHRPDFPASAPAVVLAAIAAKTERIRLTSAVTVLSSDDPVRVFQDFATLDLLSGGRAEIMAGRGSFIESFPLFGYDLADYDDLFHEKIQLLLKIRNHEFVTWEGKHRAPLVDQGVYPRPIQDRIPIWIAVGGNPGSAVRAGVLGLPMALAIIGGLPEQFVGLVDLYRETGERTGHGAGQACGQHQFSCIRRGHVSGGRGHLLCQLCERDGSNRAGTRMVRSDPCSVRGRSFAPRPPSRRQSSTGDRQDPVSARAVRSSALPGTNVGGIDGPQTDDESHRAARNRSCTGRAKGSGRQTRAAAASS